MFITENISQFVHCWFAHYYRCMITSNTQFCTLKTTKLWFIIASIVMHHVSTVF